jgi:antitoxin component YwqK of YwqJK toxin-antitoxin module
LDGPYTELYPSGQIKRNGYYENGKIHGIWISYYEDGSLLDKTYWFKGNKIEPDRNSSINF